MKELLSTILLTFAVVFSYAQAPMDGGVWKDKTGKHINAHSGNILITKEHTIGMAKVVLPQAMDNLYKKNYK